MANTVAIINKNHADKNSSHNNNGVVGCSVITQKKKTDESANMISPMCYEGFQRRFQSYQLKDWSHMPLELSPIACSKNGWILVSSEQLQCEFCNRTINMILPKKNYEFYKKVTKELVGKLISEHRTGCVWKTGLDFPEYFVTSETEKEGKLEDRFLQNTVGLSQHIDAFNGIKSVIKAQCIEDSSTELQLYAEHHNVDVLSLTVSAHGWHIKSIGKDKLLFCKICCRKLPLWSKLQAGGDVDVSKHLAWCPWVHSTSAQVPSLMNRMCTYISQQLSRKRKRESLEYKTSHQRKEELKEIVKCMRKSLS